MCTTFVHKGLYFTLEGTDGGLGVFDLDSLHLYRRHSPSEGLELLFVQHLKPREPAIGVLSIQHVVGLFFAPSFFQKILEFLVYFLRVFEKGLGISVVDFSLLLSLDRVIIFLDALFRKLSNNKFIDSGCLNVRDLTELGHHVGKFFAAQMRRVIL